MHPYLQKLGIREEVQLFFEPFYRSDEAGNLAFSFGDQAEHFSLAWHRVPRAVHWWQAGDPGLARQVFICASAMEAICFLSVNFHRYSSFDQLLFIAMGTCPSAETLCLLKQFIGDRRRSLVMGSDLLGRLQDIQVAAAIAGKSLRIRYAGSEIMEMITKGRKYAFHEAGMTLNLFEKVTGTRTGVSTCKAKGANSFLNQLMQTLNS